MRKFNEVAILFVVGKVVLMVVALCVPFASFSLSYHKLDLSTTSLYLLSENTEGCYSRSYIHQCIQNILFPEYEEIK